jgi:hypothetical protein
MALAALLFKTFLKKDTIKRKAAFKAAFFS